ncbi:MAG: Spy/CpxP family protein refolding chaperone, partial [Pseudolabrys sp.]
HRGLRASFVAWYGPVFWPYAYSDIFDYTFWPGGYDDGYWAYAYDDFLDGVFWGSAGPPEAYVYADVAPREAAPHPSQAGVVELCKEPGTGVTAWPFEEIEKAVAPTPDQEALLVNLRGAAKKAADVFKASCPSENAYPATPPGRLRAMMARLLATLDAVKTVRPELEKFYGSLSDEQKAKFNDIGPKSPSNEANTARASGDKASNGQASGENNACQQPKPGLSNLPIERIEKIVKPTDNQEDALSNLEEATNKAVATLQAACPDEMPLTPVGRMEAMESRLQAMLDAAKTVEHPLDEFYSSLSDEQKARFNRLGRQLARSN